MSRLSFIAIWIAVIVGSAFILYRVKYEVQSLKAQVIEVNKDIAQEKETLRVVSAEWSYLNRPERLKILADKYLNGQEITVGKVAEVEAIAFHKQAVASAGTDDDVRAILASYVGNSEKP